MSKYKVPNQRRHEKLQAQAARARASGPMWNRTAIRAPMRALARLQAEKFKPPPWSKKQAPPPVGATCPWCALLHSGTPRVMLGPHPPDTTGSGAYARAARAHTAAPSAR